MKYENIIYDVQIQILDDLGFRKCTVPLYTIVVIFKKSFNRKWDIRKVGLLIIDI